MSRTCDHCDKPYRFIGGGEFTTYRYCEDHLPPELRFMLEES